MLACFVFPIALQDRRHKADSVHYVHPFLLFPVSAVRRPTWFLDILSKGIYPIFTKFGMGFIGLITCMGLLLVMIAKYLSNSYFEYFFGFRTF